MRLRPAGSSRRARWLAVAATAFLVTLTGPSFFPTLAQRQPVLPDELLEERARARVEVVRLRIEPSGLEKPGHCLDMTKNDLRVLLRGDRLDPRYLVLEREHQPTLHALLIDTSGSMKDSMEHVQVAAAGYIERLNPEYESALVATFDDSVVLHQRVTSDRAALAKAVDGIRPGSMTSLYDGLHYVVREMRAHRERPVVILLTDGVDTSSLQMREDVMKLIESRRDVTIFVVGYRLPPRGRGAGKFRPSLQRMAQQTNGRFFDAPTGSQLEGIYRRIRETLDNERTLTAIDPFPEAKAGTLKIRSDRSGCRVQILDTKAEADDPLQRPLTPPFPSLPHTLPTKPDDRYFRYWITNDDHQADPECHEAGASEGHAALELGELWRAEVSPGRVRGCALDMTMELGMLYDPASPAMNWIDFNPWIRLKTRWFDIPVPPIAELPAGPEELLDRIAERARAVADNEIEYDGRRKPAHAHARPFHDLPQVFHGRMFFDLRPRIATALFLHDDYREWVFGKLRAEARRDLEDLRERFKTLAPEATDAAIEYALDQSEQARKIVTRARTPSELDLARFLSAWLGDISARDLLVRWEARRIDALLHGPASDLLSGEFADAWKEVRRVLFVPSYTRSLTLMSPVYSRDSDRIGFWRVILPRPTWIQKRMRGDTEHPFWSDLPMDLVPDLPLAYWAVHRILDEQPALATHLRDEGYGVASLDYELLTKPRRQHPKSAYRETLLTLVLEPESVRDAPRLIIEAEIRLGDKSAPRMEAIRLEPQADPALELLAAAAERELLATRRRVDPDWRIARNQGRRRGKATGEAASLGTSHEVSPAPERERLAGRDPKKRYLLIEPEAALPKNGYKLLVVLTGEGSAFDHGFVESIAREAAGDDYLVAQLVAPEWSEGQLETLVWPMARDRRGGGEFTTEQFIDAVVLDVAKEHRIDRSAVFTLSWSQAGPPAYSANLFTYSQVKGALIVMSPFVPADLPGLYNARGRAFYILHSPEDPVPIGMAEQARDLLARNGAATHLQTYAGGHEFPDDALDLLRDGIRWLEDNRAAAKD